MPTRHLLCECGFVSWKIQIPTIPGQWRALQQQFSKKFVPFDLQRHSIIYPICIVNSIVAPSWSPHVSGEHMVPCHSYLVLAARGICKQIKHPTELLNYVQRALQERRYSTKHKFDKEVNASNLCRHWKPHMCTNKYSSFCATLSKFLTHLCNMLPKDILLCS